MDSSLILFTLTLSVLAGLSGYLVKGFWGSFLGYFGVLFAAFLFWIRKNGEGD